MTHQLNIKRYVDKAIKSIFSNEDIQKSNKYENDHKAVIKFLLRHPNKKKMVENLCREMRLAELNPRIKVTDSLIEWTCTQTARVFARLALANQEKRLASELEKSRREKEANAMAELEKELEDESTWAIENKLQVSTYVNKK